MILNTGLLLQKPGESSYGRYRRFLIANNGASFTTLKKVLKKKFSVTKHRYNSTGPYLFAVLADKLEHEFIHINQQHNASPHSRLMARYRPKCCCNICAAEGYHSELFDLPWVFKCPIHNEPLTERCKECNSLWPKAHELISSECKTCGVKIPVHELAKSISNTSNDGYKLIEDTHSLIIEGYRQFSLNFYLYHHNSRDYETRPIIKPNSAFHLSVVEHILNKKSVLCHLIKIPNIEQSTFKVSQILNPSQADENLKVLDSLKVKMIIKTIKKFENLFNHKGHVLGACRMDCFPQEACLSCATFHAWKMLVNHIDNNYDGYYWSNTLFMIYATHPPTPPAMYSTICLDIYSHKDFIKIPLKLSEKIYEYDLWTTAMHLYQFLEEMMNRAEELPIIWTQYIKNCRPIILPHNSTFSPYVMKLEGNNLHVYFFKNILTTQLNESDKIDRLLSYSLNNI